MQIKKIKNIILFVLISCMISFNFAYAENQMPYNIINNYYVIPSNDYNYQYQQYFISGYDRICDRFYNGEAMMSRVPIISGQDSYLCYIANGITKPAYLSIESWCNNNLNLDKIQAFYLNSAYIESQSRYQIVLIVNCAFQKKGVLEGNTEFRCILDLANNRFTWVRVGYEKNGRNYDDRYYDKDIHYAP